MEVEEAFGEALRRCRFTKRLSQEDFVPATGRTYISALERGLKSPTIAKVDQIASIMGMHPITLLVITHLIKDDPLNLEELLIRVIDELKEYGKDDDSQNYFLTTNL